MTDQTTVEPGIRRAAALDEFDLMGTPPAEKFDRITRIARQMLGVPLSFLNLIDERNVYAKSSAPAGQNLIAPKEASFCIRTIEQSEPMTVADATLDDRFSGLSVVTGNPGIRFYAGASIRIHGTPVGAICVADTSPRTLSEDEVAILEDLARWAERSILQDIDRRNAAVVQRLLRPPAIDAEEFHIDGVSIAAGAIGGDCGVWVPVDGGCMIAVADVMGKGTGAGILAASLRGALVARSNADLATAMRDMGRQFTPDLEAVGSFATLFCGRLDYASGVLSYVDAGHGLGAHLKATGEIVLLPATTLPLGMTAELEEPEVHSVHLEPGDRVVVVSDGVLELFGSQPRSMLDLAALAGSCEGVDEFLDDARRAISGRQLVDDVTLIVVERDA